MDPLYIIEEFYEPGSDVYKILVRHSRCVAEKALAVAKKASAMNPDLDFIREAAMLHDIGIFMTRSRSLGCSGHRPYVSHGYLGRELLEKKGLMRHALVCERHVGVGITPEDIDSQGLPLPRRDMRPITIEEQIICYADKFYSKNGTAPDREKTVDEIIGNLGTYGPDKITRFLSWASMFG